MARRRSTRSTYSAGTEDKQQIAGRRYGMPQDRYNKGNKNGDNSATVRDEDTSDTVVEKKTSYEMYLDALRKRQRPVATMQQKTQQEEAQTAWYGMKKVPTMQSNSTTAMASETPIDAGKGPVAATPKRMCHLRMEMCTTSRSLKLPTQT